MKYIVMILGVLTGVACHLSASAEPSSMVQRHIFAPDQSVEDKANAAAAKPVDSAGLEKDLIFTGVLLTSNGKQVILSESGKHEKGVPKHVMKEGDSIRGMTLKEIGSNYLLLSSNENLLRIKLYKGIKSRPAPPPDKTMAEAGPAANTTTLPGNLPQNAPPGSKMDMKSKNVPGGNALPAIPFDNTGNGAFGGGGGESSGAQANPTAPAGTSAAPTTSNPFLDVIKRSAESTPAGGTPVNPFTGK
ncbi:MAG: hypothetical protein HY881_11715 [Deltaproteobacteria bacterium]|nr:hypothetical protein [Deltaproteobacteria bacterium]